MAISGSNDISLLQMGIGLLPVGIALLEIQARPVKAVNYRCRERDRSIGCRRVHPPVGFPTVGSLDTGCANSIHHGCSITSSFKTAWRTSE